MLILPSSPLFHSHFLVIPCFVLLFICILFVTLKFSLFCLSSLSFLSPPSLPPLSLPLHFLLLVTLMFLWSCVPLLLLYPHFCVGSSVASKHGTPPLKYSSCDSRGQWQGRCAEAVMVVRSWVWGPRRQGGREGVRQDRGTKTRVN